MTDSSSTGTSTPAILACAPNGARRTKTDHSRLPTTAAELGQTAIECVNAGASMVHLHVRDSAGGHLLDGDAYRDAIRAVRTTCGRKAIIQITTESVGKYSRDEQIAVVKNVRPEAASLALREFDYDGPATLATFFDWMISHDVLPQVILYNADEAQRLLGYLRIGELPLHRVPVLYVLGAYARGAEAQPQDLMQFPLRTPEFSPWMTCAFGSREAACGTATALLGGHVRVGFENNLVLPDGSTAESNADLVRAVGRPLAALGIELAEADQARQLWHAIAR